MIMKMMKQDARDLVSYFLSIKNIPISEYPLDFNG